MRVIDQVRVYNARTSIQCPEPLREEQEGGRGRAVVKPPNEKSYTAIANEFP